MLNGLYAATGGLMMQENRVNVISNNLANMNTTGFKRDMPVFTLHKPTETEYPQNMIRQSLYNETINSTSKLEGIYTDHTAGHLQETGGKFDFALEDPNAFFTIDTPYGIRYTRDGHFVKNAAGELVNENGFPVLSQAGGTIIIPEGARINFGANGEVIADDAVINQFAVARFEDDQMNNLQKQGRNLFAAIDALPVEAQAPGVINGYLEGANVNPLTEMVRMIEANRGFETYQKIVTTMDDLNDKLINQVGSVS